MAAAFSLSGFVQHLPRYSPAVKRGGATPQQNKRGCRRPGANTPAAAAAQLFAKNDWTVSRVLY